MKGANVSSIVINGTGEWEEGYQHEGVFLDWGLSTSHNGNLTVTNTVALIELKDGCVEMVDPGKLKFVSKCGDLRTSISDMASMMIRNLDFMELR